jgi:hypothetical protein
VWVGTDSKCADEAATNVNTMPSTQLYVVWRGFWSQIFSARRCVANKLTASATKYLGDRKAEYVNARFGVVVYLLHAVVFGLSPACLTKYCASLCRETSGSNAATAVTLDQCWDRFTQPEILDENNTWYCPGCKSHVQAKKSLEVWSLPKVLVLHLKRFEARNLIWRDKLTTLVNFPLAGLDLTKRHLEPVHGKKSVYDCFAVVNHFGSMMFGHYTAFANHDAARGVTSDTGSGNLKNGGLGTWMNFDDESVSEMSPSRVATEAAYILFYVRREQDGS